MRRLLMWLGYLAGMLVVLALCGVAGVYAVSEYKLRETHETPPVDLAVPSDPESIAEGRRLAELRGCPGCHRPDLQGGVFFDEPWRARIVAPNLPEALARYGVEGFARIVRFGVRPDGSTTTGMPSDMFYHLTDEDLAKIIAYIRTVEPGESDLPDTKYRIMARMMIAFDEFPPDAERVAALGPRLPAPSPGADAEYGRYLAVTVCTECHGDRLEGQRKAPSLAVVKGYSREAFGRLMAEGVALGERELDLMARVSRGRFSRFTDEEVDALFAFLQSETIPLEDEDHVEPVPAE
jgi:mono/diheme cytochrome c family protein